MSLVYIIAEAGVNHNGDILLAYELIDEAKKAGADAVKFQTFKAENLASINAEMADYQKKNLIKEQSQFEMLKSLQIEYEDFYKLKHYCEENEIEFLSTPFDIDSLNFLVDELGVEKIKIPSGEIINHPFLKEVAKKNKDTILSTGMSNLSEIEEAINIFEEEEKFNKEVLILHCTTNYPTPYNEVNLNAMLTIKSAFKRSVGYSDHTLGIEVPIAATALGAKIIEKHFTLDKNMKGPDHKASLEPIELRKMIKSIRNIEYSLGNGIKKANESELRIMNEVRKSLVINRSMKKGEKIQESDLSTKRPSKGISPKYFDLVVGRELKENIVAETLLTWDLI